MVFGETSRPAGRLRSPKSMETKSLIRAQGSYVDGPLASVLFRRRTAGGLRSYVRPLLARTWVRWGIRGTWDYGLRDTITGTRLRDYGDVIRIADAITGDYAITAITGT